MLSSIPEVPPNWIKVRFDEIATNVTDRVEKPNESDLEYYIGLDHLDTDQIRIKRFGSTEDVKATKFLCKKGDIIFGKRNSYLRKVAVTDRDAVVSAHSMVIRPKGDLIVPDFLPCFMQSNVFWKTAHAISEGSMSPTIKWKTLAKQEFWMPSAEEQKKIAEILWSVEDNIDKNEHLLKSFNKIKEGLLNQLMTKGIGHKRFKETELGKIPEEWDVIELKDISDIRRGASPRPIKDPKYFSDNGPGWIRIGDVTPIYKYIKETKQNLSDIGCSKSVKVGKGDLIMSICATIGKPAIVDMNACIHDGFVLFEKIRERVDKEYLFYTLLRNEESFKLQKQEGTQGNLNTTIVGNTKFALPNTIDEQKQIVSIFNIFDNTIDKYTNSFEYLFQLKKKLTNEFLSGKLRIPEGVLENVQ